MSERMTNIEIEDVLSSIRRLVSEDVRPAPRGPAAAAGKLVLTPDFRVVSDSTAPEAAAAPARPRREAKGPVAAPVEDLSDQEWTEATESLKGRIAVLEAAVARRAEEWDPDGSEADPMAYLTEARAMIDASRRKAEAETEAETEAWAAEPAIAEEPQAEPDEAPMIEDVIEELEPAFAFRPRDSRAEPVQEAEAEAADPDTVFEEGEEALLDEETLRDLIREIIRQELQGVLGERITRNVRKLVRAEINRALTSRDFD